MKIYSVGVKFGNKPDDRVYNYLTYFASLQPGTRVWVDVGKSSIRPKSATVASYPTEEVPEHATAWVIGFCDIEAHEKMLEELYNETK